MNERSPIRALLQDDASEAELQRVWRGVKKRRAASASPRAWIAAFALASLLVLAWAVRSSSATGKQLRDERGQSLSTLGAATASAVRLTDGSRIELSSDAKLEVLDNDGTTFACALRRGHTLFDVVPGGPRRWRIEAGAVRVEVVGTRFSVERAEGRVSVAVERGTVLVRGERVPDGVQKLEAGGNLVIDSADEATKSPPAGVPAAAPALEPPAPVASASARAPLGKVANGDLLKFADEERQRGNLPGAIQALRLAVDEGPADRRAIAAFTLGKLLLDGENRPAEAKAAFRACLRLSPPAAVAEDALARLVEAEARGGAGQAARAAASDYEKRYPNGRRLADVRRWATPH